MDKNSIKDAGFGTSFNYEPKRMINKNGSFNVKRITSINYFNDVYKYLTDISWLRFILILFCVYILFNLIFSIVYYFIGFEGLSGIEYTKNELNVFLQIFYFSCQTFTTVGYGGITPSSNGINIVAAVEAFTGLLSFSISTGLLYGRFSKPNSKISYSKNLLLASYKQGNALMFKIVNKRENILMNVDVTFMASIRKITESGKFISSYQKLELETNDITFFPLTWTIVHPITQSSPFYSWSDIDFKNTNIEFFILIKAYDDTFNQEVISYHSYVNSDIILNKKFVKNFDVDADGDFILKVNEIDKFE